MVYGKEKTVKDEKARIRERKKNLKTRSDYEADCDKAASAYIRYRDRNLSCICCGEPLGRGEVGGAFDCGHFISRRHRATRWDERNMAGQRKYCNRYRAGNQIGFASGLVLRYGPGIVEELRDLAKQNVHYSIQDLIDMTNHFKQKLKNLKRQGDR